MEEVGLWDDKSANDVNYQLHKNFDEWEEKHEAWIKEEEPDTFVNLLLNLEAYTNYQG